MSIFTDLQRRLGIYDDQLRSWELAFQKFPASKRSAKEVIDLVNGSLHDQYMAVPQEFLDANNIPNRMSALRDQVVASWQEVFRIEDEIIRTFKAAIQGGTLTEATISDAMRQCGIKSTDLQALPLLVLGAVALVVLAAIAVWRSDAIIRSIADSIVALDRGIQQNRIEALGIKRAMEIAADQAVASGKPMILPQRPSTEKGITATIGDTTTALALAGVVGVGLWAAAKIFGGKK